MSTRPRPPAPAPAPPAAPRPSSGGHRRGADADARERADAGPGGERGERGVPDVALRLAIGRAGVGIELASPTRVGCLTITELTAALPGARFPLDVSGGVARFRHRRSALATLQIEVGARAVERWAAPRLRGLVGARTPEVWVASRPAGAVVCVAAAPDPEDGPFADAPVVAFDVDAIAERGDLVLVVKRARGTDLARPATAIAIGCAERLLGGIAEQQGAAFVVRRGPRALARAVLPEAGARVPSDDGVCWAAIAAHPGWWMLHAAREAASAAPLEEALRAREAALVLREGDDALARGDVARARDAYLEALERAPRHAETLRRVLEIDAQACLRGGRDEAALATLLELRQEQGELHLGATPGEILARVGDVDAAIASLERAGDTEPAPTLSARAFETAARLTRDAEAAARLLDRAVARAPRSTVARWLRVERRLELGRLEDALADVEHIEALARRARGKYGVWARAGRTWRAAGLGARAAAIFERALRYVPDEPDALAGLGAALVAEGRAGRGVALLTRAIDLVEARPPEASGASAAASMRIDLARALAERLDDLPSAIARVAAVPADAPEAPIARGLEGRWRARLGDVAGASLAFARLRELAGGPDRARDGGSADAVASLLAEAAELHRVRLRDPLGAQRHLAAALRWLPHDAGLRRAYQEVGLLIARGPTAPAEAPDEAPAALGSPTAGVGATTDDDDAARRVDELSRRLQADPRDDAAADELASLLESLGRGHELLALLSARLEDASPQERARLAPRARAALTRLAADSDAAGRPQEAALYRDFMERWPD